MRRITGLALLFSVLLGLGTVPKAKSLHSPDFKVFYVAARHAIENPSKMYQESPDRYLYPPSTAALLVPFAFTDNYPFHQWIWHFFLATIVWFLGAGALAPLLALAVLTRYLIITFSYGQINLVVIAGLALAARYSFSDRKILGGILWGFVTSLKVYPLVFFPALVRRDAGLAWLGAISSGIFLLLLPFICWGGDIGIALYQEFFQALAAKGMPLHSHNQSFSALFLRLFTNQEFYLHAVGNTKWALLDLAPNLVRFFSFGIGLLMAILSWKKYQTNPSSNAACSATAFSILFLSHIVWKDYLLLLYFPLSELFGMERKRRNWILAIALVSLITFSAHDVIGAPLSTRMDAACIHLWGAVLVWLVWWKS